MAEPQTQSEDFQIWEYGNLKVYYKPDLDGGGTFLAAPIVRFLHNHCRYHSFNKVFEWCAGPGFIGFALLADGICDHLVLADINPAAMECVAKTVEANNLSDQVTYYTSDNLKDIPPSEKFDLVVGNPPNFFNINPEHRIGKMMQGDIRPNDPGWKIHENFYNSISQHLNPGAHLLISEVEPYKTDVYIEDPEPYEHRDHPPIIDFKSMIADNGLEYIDTLTYHYIPGTPDLNFWMVISRKKTNPLKKVFFNLELIK